MQVDIHITEGDVRRQQTAEAAYSNISINNSSKLWPQTVVSRNCGYNPLSLCNPDCKYLQRKMHGGKKVTVTINTAWINAIKEKKKNEQPVVGYFWWTFFYSEPYSKFLFLIFSIFSFDTYIWHILYVRIFCLCSFSVSPATVWVPSNQGLIFPDLK